MAQIRHEQWVKQCFFKENQELLERGARGNGTHI